MVRSFTIRLGGRGYLLEADDGGSRIAVRPCDGDGGVSLGSGGVEPLTLPDDWTARFQALLSNGGAWTRLDKDTACGLARIVARIADELNSADGALMAAALAAELLATAARAVSGASATRETGGPPPAWKPPDGVWSVDDAVRWIDGHYRDAFSVEFFTARCAINAGDFSRRFKARAGCPLFEYINRRRVARACVLLKTTRMPVIEVASAVGYNNLSFFNRYFRRITGVSPRAWRGNAG